MQLPNGQNNLAADDSEMPWKNFPIDPGYVTPDPSPPPSTRRRASVACRRCRRMRTKCVPDLASPVCLACQAAGVPPESCVYLARGTPDHDREYRHPRIRAGKPRLTHRQRRDNMNRGRMMGGGRFGNNMRSGHAGYWKYMPPVNQIIEAVRQLCGKHLQLNFISKDSFCAKLHQSFECTHPFLLASILAISARSVPAIVEHHGTATNASRFFMELASDMAYEPAFREPSLQTCQALCLLSIAQDEHGLLSQSYLSTGLGARMASLLGFHREEAYEMEDPTPIQMHESESARRTMWMLFSQENRSTANLPLTMLPVSDITALLPCSERNFTEGREPRSRAALIDAKLAKDRRGSAQDPCRSLFASMTQVYYLWGIVGRQVAQGKSPPDPADTNMLVKIMDKLREWEEKLPVHQVWSVEALREHRANGLDLSLFELNAMLRLSNVAVRKPFLQDILDGHISRFRQARYKKFCYELYLNVCTLFHQIEVHFADHHPQDVADPQGMDTCVYECGINAAYICRYPGTCQDENIVENAPRMLSRVLNILQEKRAEWIFAASWIDELLDIHSLPLVPVADIPEHSLPQLVQQSTTETKIRTVPKTISTIKTENPSIVCSPVSDTTATVGRPSPPMTSLMGHASGLNPMMPGLSVIIPRNPPQPPWQEQNPQQPSPPFQGQGESLTSLPLSAPLTPETHRAFYYTSPTSAGQTQAFGSNPTFYVGFVAPTPTPTATATAKATSPGGHVVDLRSSPSSFSQAEPTFQNGQQVYVLRPGQDWDPNVPRP